MEIIIKLMVHLLPLVPLVMGYPYAAFATFLAVVLCYVKVKKLEQQILDSREDDPSLHRARNFWRRLTFMR